MAGKRHSGSLEHMFYHKMSRVEMAQHSIPCTGKTIAKDQQVCKNVFTYPLSGSDGQNFYNPWNSAAAYLQYAGNALNQHLQSGVSQCQRSENERINNPLQLSSNSSNQYSAPQHPVHNYRMSPSRAYPSIAVPRPVYRSPNSFIDPAYQTRDFQTMGVHVGSQSPVEWGSTARFPYSSTPLYVSGIKSIHPAPNGYLEANGGLSSHHQSVQELGPVHRHRTDTNTALGSSPSCYQDDVFRDRIHSFAQQNMQLLCAESSVSGEKQRNSAFTTPTQEHYKCTAYQGSPDTRMGHMYSKPYCDSAIDSYHQRSALYSSNVDKSISPLSINGSTSYGKAQKLHMGYVNQDSRSRTQFDDGTQVSQSQAEQEIQFSSTSRTSREMQMCSDQRDNASLFGSVPMNKDFCVNSANMEKEHVLGSTRVSNNLHQKVFHEKCIKEKSSQNSFLQQNSSFNTLPASITKNIITNEPDRGSTVISKLPTSPSSLHHFDDSRQVNTTMYKPPSQNRSSTTETANTDCSGAIFQSEKCKDSQTSCYESEAEQISGCALPQASKVDGDGPQSPPMPVINDVFSLAPYRAYLEGKAPHPFPVHKESEVQTSVSTSSVSQQSCSTEEAVQMENDALKLETIPAVVNSEYHDSKNAHAKANAQSNESLDANSSNDAMDAEVLDLSLKRSVQTSLSSQEQLNMSPSSHKPSSKLVTERNLSRVSEDVSVKNQGSCLSEVTKIMPNSEKELHKSHTTVITSSPSVENDPFQATEKTTCLSQESYTTAKSYICQSQDISESQSHETQELQRNYLCQATKSLAHENLVKHSLLASKNVPSSVHENNSYQVIQNQPLYANEQCKPHIQLSQQMEGKCSSQALQNITTHVRNHCPSQDVASKPDKLFEKSYYNKWICNQAVETQPKNLQETYKSQTPETPPLQQICSQTTEEVSCNRYYGSISVPSKTYSVQSSTQSTNISLFVNTIQTPTTFFPQAIFFTSPAAVLCHKNKLPIPKHPSHLAAATERRPSKSVDSCQSETSLSESENESTGFHSSKAFMIRKYKMRRLSTSGTEDQEGKNSSSRALPKPFLPPSDAAQSLPPSAPESSPTLGEANVSLASADEVAPNGSGKQFSELHRLVRSAITSSVARSPSNLLEEWLEKTKDPERGKTPAKAKSGSRPNDLLAELPARDIWQDFDGVRLCLYKLLSQLETFMFTRSCPFPHVIRAGAIFIPIYLVKEVLFPELGTSVDRVLQKHKVELRPTTLSEEKLLRETELKDCPSRMLKLLALKQLPDVYPDLLHLFCKQTIQNHLGSFPTKCLEKSEWQTSSASKERETTSPRKGQPPLIMRLQRVCKSPGSRVYKALQARPLEKRNTEKLPARKVCRKKSYKDRTLMYKQRRRVQSTCSESGGFPNLVGKRILHLFDDGECETWFPGKVLRVHRHSFNPQDTEYEVLYDSEPGISYFLELLQDYEKGWLKLDT